MRWMIPALAAATLLPGLAVADPSYPPGWPPSIPGFNPPKCKLEPGGGPMRCANPNVPNSFYGRKMFLFTYVRLPIEGQKKVDPLCYVFVPQTMSGLHNAEGIEPQIDPDFPTERPYYKFITYTIDFAKKDMHITQVMPGDGTAIDADAHVELFDEPQARWPCRPRNFEARIGNFELDPSLVPNQRPMVANTPPHKLPDVRQHKESPQFLPHGTKF